MSLEAQETELKEFALRENLLIAATFRESQTAKEPGRPIFNDMLKRMESGEAEGILVVWIIESVERKIKCSRRASSFN